MSSDLFLCAFTSLFLSEFERWWSRLPKAPKNEKEIHRRDTEFAEEIMVEDRR
jgi:hypothetical protein